MKKLLIILVALVLPFVIKAQYEVEALRFSDLTFGGTARFMGSAGAFGALGADISTLHTNPAGIGLYKSNEMTFSPTLFFGKTESTYNGYSMDDYKGNFNIGNIGFVSVFPAKNKQAEQGWKNFQFGFDLVRNNNFNYQISSSGKNMESSLLDVWNNNANGKTVNNLDSYSTYLAYDTYLLNSDSLSGIPNNYTNAIPAGGVTQSQGLQSSGYMNEWVISFGGNYNDKLFLGASFAFPYLHYSESKTYQEDALSQNLAFEEFKTMHVYDNLDIKGHGFNFKFGIIYKPFSFVRMGLAYHSPTNFYHMSESYNTTVSSFFDNGDNFVSHSPQGLFDYKLTTPQRFIGSLAFIIGTRGFISGEYEAVDYSQSNYRSSFPGDFVDANNTIHAIYRSTGNLRIGAEYKLDNISLRGGYALYGSPYADKINDGARTSYTFGLGFRSDSFFLDLATVLTYASEKYYFYQLENKINPVVNKTHNQTYVMTMGIRF